MKLTIIRDMGLVHVDGRGHAELDMSSVPSNVRAVQWDNNSGEIEYTDRNNEPITSLPSWASDIATARKAIIDAEIAEEEAAAAYLLTDAGKAELIRNERDSRLKVTDWWVLPDRTPSDAQLAYRQALRDITNQETFPTSVVWPTI